MKHLEKFTSMRNYLVNFKTIAGHTVKTEVIAESEFHACALANHKFFKAQPLRKFYSAKLIKV